MCDRIVDNIESEASEYLVDSVNAHAEDLREYFVAHEGKKELLIFTDGTRHTLDFAWMARTFARMLDEHVRAPAPKDHCIPFITPLPRSPTRLS